MQNVGLSVRGFNSSFDLVWLVTIYLPIIKCFELLEDWHYLYKYLWTYLFLSRADRLSGRVPLAWDTPWLCANGTPSFPRATALGCFFIIQQSLFKKHPNYLLVLWLWRVSLSQCGHSGRTAWVTDAPSTHLVPCQLAPGGPRPCHGEDPGGAAQPYILTNSTQPHSCGVSYCLIS